MLISPTLINRPRGAKSSKGQARQTRTLLINQALLSRPASCSAALGRPTPPSPPGSQGSKAGLVWGPLSGTLKTRSGKGPWSLPKALLWGGIFQGRCSLSPASSDATRPTGGKLAVPHPGPRQLGDSAVPLPTGPRTSAATSVLALMLAPGWGPWQAFSGTPNMSPQLLLASEFHEKYL